jgi:hypothetical protein
MTDENHELGQVMMLSSGEHIEDFDTLMGIALENKDFDELLGLGIVRNSLDESQEAFDDDIPMRIRDFLIALYEMEENIVREDDNNEDPEYYRYENTVISYNYLLGLARQTLENESYHVLALIVTTIIEMDTRVVESCVVSVN